MRPIYETEKDRAREESIAEALASMWNVDMVRRPVLSSADYEARCGMVLLAIVEIKTRTNVMRKYRTYALSLAKWMTLLEESRDRDATAIVVVSWADVTGMVVVCEPGRFDISTTGSRKGRGDPIDTEPMVHVPVEAFTILSSLKRSD